MDDIIYDSDRMLFYSSHLDYKSINIINSIFPSTDTSSNIIRQLDTYDSKQVILKDGAISQIGICLTENCNLRCKYCFNSSTNGHTDYLTLPIIETFITDMIKKWVIRQSVLDIRDVLKISFTGGGEPTYDWDFFVSVIDLIEQKCKDYDVEYSLSLTTNGTLLEEHAKYIGEHFSSVMVSYDGCPKMQRKNRGSADGTDYLPSIEKAIQILSTYPCRLTIRSTVFFDDLHALCDMADYLYSHFTISEWGVMPVIPLGRGKSALTSSTDYSDVDFLGTFIKLKKYVSEKYSALVSSPLFSSTETLLPCGGITILGNGVWLLPDGKLATCVEECEGKPYIGHVDESGIHYYEVCSDIFLELTQIKMKECKNCIAYRFCKGGCPMKHIMYKEQKRENWDCMTTIQYWEYVFSEILAGRECFNCRGIPHEIDGVGTVIKLEVQTE